MSNWLFYYLFEINRYSLVIASFALFYFLGYFLLLILNAGVLTVFTAASTTGNPIGSY